MSALQRIARPIIMASSRRSMSSIETFEKPPYDILPVPKGSWQEDYNRRNASANRILALGVVIGLGVFAHACTDPLKPVVKSDMPIDPRKGI